MNDQRIAPEIEQSFKRSFEAHDMLSRLTLLDAELAHAASRGAGYAGSLNLTLYQGRDIGASIGCDFFFLIKSETSRRSSFATPVYYEAATSVMLVSTRTGKLVMWNRVAAESENASDAGRLMFDKFNRAVWTYRVAVLRRAEDESRARQVFIAEPSVTTSEMPVVIDEDSPSPDTGNDTDKKDASEKLAGDKVKGEGLTKQSVRPPQPYRRPRPAYTESARDAGVEATIDVEVDVLPDGTVGRVEVVRWGGFGLDEAVTDSIKQTYFRPAMRDGAAVLSRVLLRYNFRRPANATSHATTPN